MAKPPADQFYYGDYIRDTRSLSLKAKGAWMDILAHGFFKTPQGRISQSLEDWAIMFGCSLDDAESVLEAIKKHQVGDVTKERNGDTTVTNRRQYRAWEDSVSNRERQARFRERGGGDPEKWTALRAIVLTRDGKMCAYCGRKAVTVDHVIPKSKGGDHDPSNLVACCKRCNNVKSSRTPLQAGMKFIPSFDFSMLAEKTLIAAGIGVSPPRNGSNNGVTSISSSSPSSSDLKEEIDDRETNVSIINLHRAYTKRFNEHDGSKWNGKWTKKDDAIGKQFNSVDISIVELGIIQTQVNKGIGNGKIQSFQYYANEIQLTAENGQVKAENLQQILQHYREQLDRWFGKPLELATA